MERNRRILIGVLSALITVYGAATNQLLFVIVGILLVLATGALVFVKRPVSRVDVPGASGAEFPAEIMNLKTSAGPVKLDQQRIDLQLDVLEKK